MVCKGDVATSRSLGTDGLGVVVASADESRLALTRCAGAVGFEGGPRVSLTLSCVEVDSVVLLGAVGVVLAADGGV